MELLGSRCHIGGGASEKGEVRRTYEVVCQLWKRYAVATPTLHSVISPPRVRLRFAEEIVLEVSRLLSMWKNDARLRTAHVGTKGC